MGGAISGLLGTAGGTQGTGYAAPAGANIQQPTTTAQATEQYGNAQQGLAQQQAFLQAVQAQNGLGNQTSTFNQLQGVANGTGPNPAQAALAQATGQNVANTASQLAGQRGANANVGLMARQIGQQGAATQQQAAGQAATMQANQSLNALGQMGSLATNQANQQANAVGAYTGATQGEQGQILGGINAQNQASVGSQQSVNSGNAALAGQVATGQQNILGGVAGGLGSALGLAKGGEVAMPTMSTQVYADGGVTKLNPNSAPTVASASGPQSRIGQYMSNPSTTSGASQTGRGVGKSAGAAGKAAFNYFSPSSTPGTSAPNAMSQYQGTDTPATDTTNATPSSGQNYMDSTTGTQAPAAADIGAGADVGDLEVVAAKGGDVSKLPQMYAGGGMSGLMQMAPLIAMAMAQGGKVPAMVSPGERYLSPEKVNAVAKGADPIKSGKKIPGTPKVKGAKNSYANDTVPATLAEGGIVLPRSVTEAKHPAWEAHKFVGAILAKKGLPKK